VISRGVEPARLTAGAGRAVRIGVNLAGAAGAAMFAVASGEFFLHTHRLIGAVFLAEQLWFVIAFVIRRPPAASSWRAGDWILACCGTFGGVLLRPAGLHPSWGVAAGLGLQLAGLAICLASLVALGRSFGFVAADRGLVTHGPYAIVRHPVYAAYIIVDAGYVLQSASVRNVVVVALVTGCNIGRALAEERLLTASAGYAEYRGRVRRRLVPGLW
jgi:protein-S-isoprenylcysteine O-methyltransferase Ste14